MSHAAPVNDNNGTRSKNKEAPDHRRLDARRDNIPPRVLSFSSGKGGVGKTNMVANIAIAMARLGKRVLILDADLGLANIDVVLGIAPRYNIKHILSGERTLREVLVQGPEGVLILPAGSGVPELVNLGEDEKLFLLNEMEDLGQSLDVMLIDNAAGISDNVLYFNLAAQERVVVVTPEPTSITDAYALIKVLTTKHQVKSFSILVNWAQNMQHARRVFRQLATVADRFLGLVSMDFIGFVTKDEAIPRAILQQRAVLDVYPESKASKNLMELAQSLITAEQQDAFADGNIKFFWKHLLRV